jgi:hypothetical protein
MNIDDKVAGNIKQLATNFYGKSHGQLSKNLIYVCSDEIYQRVYDNVVYQEAVRMQLYEKSRNQQ